MVKVPSKLGNVLLRCLKRAGIIADVVVVSLSDYLTDSTGNKLLCPNDRCYDIYYDFVHNRGRTLLFK